MTPPGDARELGEDVSHAAMRMPRLEKAVPSSCTLEFGAWILTQVGMLQHS